MSGGGFGGWEFLFTAAVTYVAYCGLAVIALWCLAGGPSLISTRPRQDRASARGDSGGPDGQHKSRGLREPDGPRGQHEVHAGPGEGRPA